MGRQRQIEQIWVSDDERRKAERLAEYFTQLGYDLTPTAPNAPEGSISYTKLVKILIEQQMSIIKKDGQP